MGGGGLGNHAGGGSGYITYQTLRVDSPMVLTVNVGGERNGTLVTFQGQEIVASPGGHNTGSSGVDGGAGYSGGGGWGYNHGNGGADGGDGESSSVNGLGR